jgi:uncharacterized protein (TIGR02421 family)
MKTSDEAYRHNIRALSQRMVKAQQPIRILDSVKWGSEIQSIFFAKQCKELPPVNREYYQKNKLLFNLEEKQKEFQSLAKDITCKLGSTDVANIMLRMCNEYRSVLYLLQARGTSEFSLLSQKLYGSVNDPFYVGAPSLKDLAKTVSAALNNIKDKTVNDLDEKKYTSEGAAKLLNQRLSEYFGNVPRTESWVKVSDGIVADAAAGAELIKIRKDTLFSERDLKILEVHEGWVHMASTLNGLQQPICSFLSKAVPSATLLQEGLAIIMEIFQFVSSPLRIKKLTDRVSGIAMAEQGADFIDVFKFFVSEGFTQEDSYKSAVRIFRGSLPDKGPFGKDLVYSKGFILIYNYLRLAVRAGLIDRIPLLFIGKTSLEDQLPLSRMLDEGLVIAPRYVPRQFSDLAALSCWMCYSVFLNKLDLEKVAIEYPNLNA